MSSDRTKIIDAGGRALVLAGLRLVVVRGVDRRRSLEVRGEEITIGTSPSADLVLTDATVSRSHAVLRATPTGYLLTDLESTNGTWIGARRIVSAYVDVKDVFQVGDTSVRLEGMRETVELPISQAAQFGDLVGGSVPARRLFAQLEQLAGSDASVLLEGETGTGKDAIAEALHERGPRARGPFVILDCSAVPPHLIEAELFGHEKGAFTGATTTRRGLFEEAHGGTLFIDEIGELPKELQPKLLRALEHRQVRRLGSTQPHSFDVRVIAATHRDLKREVNRGAFREDLYYRLNVVRLRVPPLRERLEDIPLLCERFWQECAPGRGEPPAALIELFRTHAWPGNVRELRNRVERAATMGTPREITGVRPQATSYGQAKAEAIEAFERAFLTELLARSKGNVSQAAREAQMDRMFLRKLLQRRGLLPSG
jgi:DNA-binding NtrC family response regulator